MRTYLFKTPKAIQKIFPNWMWRVPTTKKAIYLTFDDGPTAQLGPWILQTLDRFEAKATFFCVGENIVKNSELTQEMLRLGHQIGNHTHNHLNGWNTGFEQYISNIDQCDQIIQNQNITNKLFRPPYGKLTKKQSAELLKRGYKIVMWDVLSGDFDVTISADSCLKQLKRNTSRGSIIVFHDNVKSEDILKKVLPEYLSFVKNEGFTFELCPS